MICKIPGRPKRTEGLPAPDLTVNTLLAMDSVNGMFQKALPQECQWQPLEATQTVRLPDATVTVSTRAAMEAVSSMFKASLPHEGFTQEFQRASSHADQLKSETGGYNSSHKGSCPISEVLSFFADNIWTFEGAK